VRAEFTVRDHDAGGMDTGMTLQAFRGAAPYSVSVDFRVTGAFLLEFRDVFTGHRDRRPSSRGINLAMRSTSWMGNPITRPTSRTTRRASIDPKVMIWATLDSPYL